MENAAPGEEISQLLSLPTFSSPAGAFTWPDLTGN